MRGPVSALAAPARPSTSASVRLSARRLHELKENILKVGFFGRQVGDRQAGVADRRQHLVDVLTAGLIADDQPPRLRQLGLEPAERRRYFGQVAIQHQP